jgi:glycosyltransferase AglE
VRRSGDLVTERGDRLGADHHDEARPVVISVIVPHYNDAERLGRLLDRLKDQRSSFGDYEIIVVDNGSTEPVAVDEGPRLRLLTEPRRGSYAARNRGLQEAKGDVIAFTDSDCLPTDGWLEEGYKALRDLGADLVGGRVRFTFSRATPTGAELVDATTNLRVESYIRHQRAAATANLFVHRRVVERIGRFPSELRSGGDIAWTQRASREGMTLKYAPRAEVLHPARRLGGLLSKQYRVGRGLARIARARGDSGWRIILRSFSRLIPPSPARVQAILRRQTDTSHAPHAIRVWGALWASRIATALGNWKGTFD